MNQNTIIVVVIALALGVGGGYMLFGAPSAQPNNGQHMMADGSMMSRNIDQHFIAQMIPHHEGAIEMAKVALERSKRSEIISLANGIIEAQEREITDMRAWHQSWFGSAPAAGGHGMHMGGMEGDIERLKAASATEFDREFIEQMIPHHEMAVMMAEMLQAATERDEMKTLADNIITSQSREITMMRGWLQNWYGE